MLFKMIIFVVQLHYSAVYCFQQYNSWIFSVQAQMNRLLQQPGSLITATLKQHSFIFTKIRQLTDILFTEYIHMPKRLITIKISHSTQQPSLQTLVKMASCHKVERSCHLRLIKALVNVREKISTFQYLHTYSLCVQIVIILQPVSQPVSGVLTKKQDGSH